MDDILKTEMTHAHSKLVSGISSILANKAGYNKDETEVVTKAASLHDYGKNFIPEEILKKPGKLTEEEFSVVKTHVQEGFGYLIQQAKIYLTAAIVALQHHEKPMGIGYAGVTHIHTYARLVAIADVFDALLSKRPYKEGWAVDEIIKYMKDNVHKEFDADYVDILIGSLDEIMELYQREDKLVTYLADLD